MALVVKNATANAGDLRDAGLIPGQDDPGRKAWRPTPVFCLENPMDRGAWRATVHRVAKSQIRLEWLSTRMLLRW